MNFDAGVGKWTAIIVSHQLPGQSSVTELDKYKHGICYVDGCPVDPQATQSLLERVAHIRHTHYGIR